MTREQLERLVWSNKHSDFRGTLDGRRSITRFADGVGTTLVILDEMSLGELCDSLPASVLVKHGLVYWRLVLCGESNRVLGVFGSALRQEASDCVRRVWEQARKAPRPKQALCVGYKPAVGEIYDESRSTIAAGKARPRAVG